MNLILHGLDGQIAIGNSLLGDTPSCPEGRRRDRQPAVQPAQLGRG